MTLYQSHECTICLYIQDPFFLLTFPNFDIDNHCSCTFSVDFCEWHCTRHSELFILQFLSFQVQHDNRTLWNYRSLEAAMIKTNMIFTYQIHAWIQSTCTVNHKPIVHVIVGLPEYSLDLNLIKTLGLWGFCRKVSQNLIKTFKRPTGAL